MKRSQLFLVAGGVVLVVLLMLLPKVIINKDKKDTFAKNGAARDAAAGQAPASEGHLAETPASQVDEAHTRISPAAAAGIAALRRQLAAATDQQARIRLTDTLAGSYKKAGRFDSAGVYYEQLAALQPTERNYQRAADEYYQAFSFATNEERAKTFGEKTRNLYAEVLKRNPGNLDAKTNMGMTFIASETPMKGIMALREVLETDPKNEKALYNMGVLSMQSGQFGKAVERFRQLVAVNPDNLQGQFYLGVALAESGQKKEARQLFSSLRKKTNDPAIQTSVDEYLQKLNEDGQK